MDAHPTFPPVVVVGAGAIGLYLAARLSAVTPVTLLARGPRVEVLAREGFRLGGAEAGEFQLPVSALEPAFTLDPAALVLVAVKATQLEPLLAELGPRLHPNQRVALLQNGLGVHTLVQSAWPQTTLVRVTCWVGVSLEGDREAVVAGAPLFELGADDPAGRAASALIKQLLDAAHLRAREVGSVASAEWRKALLNLAVSGICSIVGEQNGAIIDSSDLSQIVDDVLGEALPVAEAEGVILGEMDIKRVFTALHNTRHNWNAMLQDMRRGAPTEMPFLNAAVERLARWHGLSAPVNGTIARLITYMARVKG